MFQKYKILQSDSLIDLELQVNNESSNGYFPLGNVSVSYAPYGQGPTYSQSLFSLRILQKTNVLPAPKISGTSATSYIFRGESEQQAKDRFGGGLDYDDTVTIDVVIPEFYREFESYKPFVQLKC
jgi:hypothetical protein